MSILFTVLGLGFLAGGAYAIVEGWPYLLIERGFTLVIVGVVLMTAGVLMLALSRVMAELARVRGQLSNAVMAVSVASMANARDEREPASALPSGAASYPDDLGAPVVPVAIGAAAAGGILAAGIAAASRDAPGRADDASDEARRDDERDLFAAPADVAAEVASPPERDAGWTPAPWPEPDAQAPADTDGEPVATPDEFEAALIAATEDALSLERAGDEPKTAAEPVDGPESVGPASTLPDTATSGSIDEDFDRLRDRLGFGGERAAWDAEAAPTLSGERREPSARDIDSASDWMTAVRPGQDRWFSEPASPEPEIFPRSETLPEPELLSEPETLPEPGFSRERETSPAISQEPPVWPPQTREAAPFEPEHARADEIASPAKVEADEPAVAIGELSPQDMEIGPEPEPLPTFALLPEPEPEVQPESRIQSAPETPAQPEQATAPVTERLPEPVTEPEPVAPAAPAASEEGIVGAYQVGTAHFTIYADGSIQARTPEGDYSFASMDELKTYLASEKNRLSA